MNNQFLSYEQSLSLKELGFDELCLMYFSDKSKELLSLSERDVSFFQGTSNSTFTKAPLYQQAFRWFREEYDMAHEITYAGAKGRYNAFTDDWVYDSNGELKKFSYEEAELACLRKLIEIVNQNKDELQNR